MRTTPIPIYQQPVIYPQKLLVASRRCLGFKEQCYIIETEVTAPYFSQCRYSRGNRKPNFGGFSPRVFPQAVRCIPGAHKRKGRSAQLLHDFAFETLAAKGFGTACAIYMVSQDIPRCALYGQKQVLKCCSTQLGAPSLSLIGSCLYTGWSQI